MPTIPSRRTALIAIVSLLALFVTTMAVEIRLRTAPARLYVCLRTDYSPLPCYSYPVKPTSSSRLSS